MAERLTSEQLAQLRICDCGGNHQIDGNEVGLCDDGHATTCPNDPTYNAAFVARLERSEPSRWRDAEATAAPGSKLEHR